MPPKTCPNCGKENKPEARYCIHCGETLPEEEQPCPECGFLNPPAAKFCQECGRPLGEKRCPGCGNALERDAKFCPECGFRLDGAGAEAAAPKEREAELPRPAADMEDGELRTVTVLFADVSGFTAMSERLSPDVVHAVMDRILARLAEVIVEHGGRVDKYIGDCIMAEFGLPRAQDNDPQMAVDAALGMQAVMKDLGDEIEPEHGVRPRLRIGVNTGLVLAGHVGREGEKSYTVMGDAVNLASRLESAAPTGSVLISHYTYRHVVGLYDLHALDPIRVKGKKEPVRVVEVLGRRAGGRLLPLRGLHDVEIRMIGRDVELQMLHGYFRQIRENRYMEAVTVSGQAGIGKSRLVLEFLRLLEEREEQAAVFEAQCLPHGVADPFSPWHETLASFFGIDATRSPAAAYGKIAEKLCELEARAPSDWTPERLAEVLAFVMAIDVDSPGIAALKDAQNAAANRRKGFEGLATLLRMIGEGRGVVLVVEDLHWAPEGLAELVTYLLEALRDSPVLAVITTRPEAVEDGRWRCASSRHHMLQLRPLPEVPARNLVTHILRRAGRVDREFKDWIVRRGGGNPLLTEELIRHMIELGRIVVSDDGWRLRTETWEGMTIPTTIAGLIERRIDVLSPEEKRLCQQAAVAGDVFWDGLLGAMGAGEVGEILERLEARDIIIREAASSLPGEKEYRFKLPLAREVLYDTTLLRNRHRYHEQCARWMEARFTDRLDEFAVRLAEHHERCGHEREALRYHMIGARRLLAVYSNRQARIAFERCLDLAASLMEKEESIQYIETVFEIYQGMGFIDEHIGEYDRAAKVYGEAMEFMATHQDHHLSFQWRTEFTVNLVTVRAQRGQYEQALADLERGHEFLDRYRKPSAVQLQLHGKLHYWNGWVLQQLGRYEEALENYKEGLESLGDDVKTKAGATILSGMAVTYQYLDDWDNALETSLRSLAIKEALGAHKQVATELINIGLIHVQRRDWAGAETFLRRGLDISEKIGDVNKVAAAYCNLGEMFVAADDPDQAEKYLKLSLEKFESIGAAYGFPEIYRQLAIVAHRQDDDDLAEKRLDKSLHWARELNAKVEEERTLKLREEWAGETVKGGFR